MCGIIGYVSQRDVSPDQLKAMSDTIAYRGPDDSGEEIFSFRGEKTIGLAQRRLSIQDLSEKGHQPFHSTDNEVIIVFNGEIYNFLQLKKELVDYQFISTCDTEVIVAAYQRWGMAFVDHIDGMFAIALFDRKAKKLILVRDRIGKKPLYYSWDGYDFVFGSTLKPIMAYPWFERKVDRSTLPRFLFNGYIAGTDCILEGVHKLAPGQMLVFDGETVHLNTYWSIIECYARSIKNPTVDYFDAKQQLHNRLAEAVKCRMIADVPVGTFLSGGFDSSLVTAIAQSISTEPVRTFSIGFEEREYDEAPFASAVAKHLGTIHTNHYVTQQEMLDLVVSIPDYFDEPFADSSQIPSMLVSKIAKEHVSVVLTGDGGDEFFCGYRMYEKLALAQRIEPFAQLLRPFINGELREKMPYRVRSILENTNNCYKTQLGRSSYYECINNMLPGVDRELFYNESRIPEDNWQIRRMLLDTLYYLPDNNLCKVDRATMRYSLEARNPLLDCAFIEESFKTPHKFKYYKNQKKYVLKDICFDYIPRELLDRPKKGFSVPTAKWLRGPLRRDLLAVSNRELLKKQDIFAPDFTANLVEHFLEHGDEGSFSGRNMSHVIWPFYMFQKWYQHYME